jgi:hypothetical protein
MLRVVSVETVAGHSCLTLLYMMADDMNDQSLTVCCKGSILQAPWYAKKQKHNPTYRLTYRGQRATIEVAMQLHQHCTSNYSSSSSCCTGEGEQGVTTLSLLLQQNPFHACIGSQLVLQLTKRKSNVFWTSRTSVVFSCGDRPVH